MLSIILKWLVVFNSIILILFLWIESNRVHFVVISGFLIWFIYLFISVYNIKEGLV